LLHLGSPAQIATGRDRGSTSRGHRQSTMESQIPPTPVELQTPRRRDSADSTWQFLAFAVFPPGPDRSNGLVGYAGPVAIALDRCKPEPPRWLPRSGAVGDPSVRRRQTIATTSKVGVEPGPFSNCSVQRRERTVPLPVAGIRATSLPRAGVAVRAFGVVQRAGVHRPPHPVRALHLVRQRDVRVEVGVAARVSQ
jgi:hypothetical protein